MLKIKWTDRVTNDGKFYKERKKKDYFKNLKNGRQSWIGHTVREIGHTVREIGHTVGEIGHTVREIGHTVREIWHSVREIGHKLRR